MFIPRASWDKSVFPNVDVHRVRQDDNEDYHGGLKIIIVSLEDRETRDTISTTHLML